jgi:hypothetical protein
MIMHYESSLGGARVSPLAVLRPPARRWPALVAALSKEERRKAGRWFSGPARGGGGAVFRLLF